MRWVVSCMLQSALVITKRWKGPELVNMLEVPKIFKKYGNMPGSLNYPFGNILKTQNHNKSNNKSKERLFCLPYRALYTKDVDNVVNQCSLHGPTTGRTQQHSDMHIHGSSTDMSYFHGSFPGDDRGSMGKKYAWLDDFVGLFIVLLGLLWFLIIPKWRIKA